jgi:protein SCO1/2
MTYGYFFDRQKGRAILEPLFALGLSLATSPKAQTPMHVAIPASTAQSVTRSDLCGRPVLSFDGGYGLKVLLTFLLTAAALIVPAAFAHEGHDMHAGHNMAPATVRTTANYAVPDVKLVRDDGKSVQLRQEMDDGRPVVLNFIYTTCTTVCPLSSQAFSELQAKLGAKRDAVHLVSISIDPEQDTPARLRDYAKKYGAGPEWQHYTGTRVASIATQRAFNVYRGDKMEHAPVTLVRVAPGKPWVRLDGFATPDDVLKELRDEIASR